MWGNLVAIGAWRKSISRNCHKRTHQINTDRKRPKAAFARARRRYPYATRGIGRFAAPGPLKPVRIFHMRGSAAVL